MHDWHANLSYTAFEVVSFILDSWTQQHSMSMLSCGIQQGLAMEPVKICTMFFGIYQTQVNFAQTLMLLHVCYNGMHCSPLFLAGLVTMCTQRPVCFLHFAEEASVDDRDALLEEIVLMNEIAKGGNHENVIRVREGMCCWPAFVSANTSNAGSTVFGGHSWDFYCNAGNISHKATEKMECGIFKRGKVAKPCIICCTLEKAFTVASNWIKFPWSPYVCCWSYLRKEMLREMKIICGFVFEHFLYWLCQSNYATLSSPPQFLRSV